jgi:hypothetical protein
VIAAMPTGTIEQRRDRALVAFLILFDLRAAANVRSCCEVSTAASSASLLSKY